MHMTIHEYGKEKEKVVILIHPSLVMWDYFENVIPLMEGNIIWLYLRFPVTIRTKRAILQALRKSLRNWRSF